MNKKVLYQGAEAIIYKTRYLGKIVVIKQRISKSYRIKEIDNPLIASRTKSEAKLISEARSYAVSVPIIYDVDLTRGRIIMEYLAGDRIKDILNTISSQKRKKLCTLIGERIARLHTNDLIHGDITTSNMILQDDRLYFIDFGLGMKSSEIETKGVDLHVLMQAFESTHSQHSDCFKYALEGYQKKAPQDSKKVITKIDEIIKRGRYR